MPMKLNTPIPDSGRMVEEGNYEELMGRHGFFAELVKRQQI